MGRIPKRGDKNAKATCGPFHGRSHPGLRGDGRPCTGTDDGPASPGANSTSSGSERWRRGIWKVAHAAGWLHRRTGNDPQSNHDADDLRSDGYRRRWGDLVARVPERARTNFQGDGQQQGWPPYTRGAGNVHAWNSDTRPDAACEVKSQSYRGKRSPRGCSGTPGVASTRAG